eukprot:UN27491
MSGGSLIVLKFFDQGNNKSNKVLLWPFGTFIENTILHDQECCINIVKIITLIPLLILFVTLRNVTKSQDCKYIFMGYDDSSWMNCFGSNYFGFGISLSIFLMLFNIFIPVYPLYGSKLFIRVVKKMRPDIELDALAKACMITTSFYVILFLMFLLCGVIGCH